MRTIDSLVQAHPVVAQVYLSPRQSPQGGEVTRWVGLKPDIPSAIPEQLLALVKTGGDRHKNFVAAGIGERVVTAAITRPTYGTRYRQETTRPLKYLHLIPVSKSVPERYRSGDEPMPFNDIAKIPDDEGGPAAIVGYDLMSRSSSLSHICRDINDRPGNRCIQGVVLPVSEARELTAKLRGEPSAIREFSHLALERVIEGLGAVPSPDYDLWPNGINRIQFTDNVLAGPTDGFIATLS